MKESPIEKVPEAWTALADGRVTLAPGADAHSGRAEVSSSDGSKSYTVEWGADGKIFASTDPASYWQGYAGYPVIAVLMKLGRLPVDEHLAKEFSGVNWTELNAQYKRNYAAALQHLETERGIDPRKVRNASEATLNLLRESGITLKRKLPRS